MLLRSFAQLKQGATNHQIRGTVVCAARSSGGWQGRKTRDISATVLREPAVLAQTTSDFTQFEEHFALG
jgi:hypothetical protein